MKHVNVGKTDASSPDIRICCFLPVLDVFSQVDENVFRTGTVKNSGTSVMKI